MKGKPDRLLHSKVLVSKIADQFFFLFLIFNLFVSKFIYKDLQRFESKKFSHFPCKIFLDIIRMNKWTHKSFQTNQPTNFHSPETVRNSTDSWNTTLLGLGPSTGTFSKPRSNVLLQGPPLPPSFPKNHTEFHLTFTLRKNPPAGRRREKSE